MGVQEPPISFPLTHFSPWVANSARAHRDNNPCEMEKISVDLQRWSTVHVYYCLFTASRQKNAWHGTGNLKN